MSIGGAFKPVGNGPGIARKVGAGVDGKFVKQKAERGGHAWCIRTVKQNFKGEFVGDSVER